MARVEIVTSAANPLLKLVRRSGERGTLTPDGLWIAEGFHLLEEASRSRLEVPTVLAAESVLAVAEAELSTFPDSRLIAVPDRLFREISTTEATQGVIALVRPPEWRMDEVFHRESPVMVLDGIQDPGNAGAIVRASEAFSASGVIFVRGTASPHHPKTLRAATGSLFRLPFVGGVDVAATRAALACHGRSTYAAMPHRSGIPSLEEVNLERNCALIIGGEGRGVDPGFLEMAAGISIATAHVESLNAATAAAVLLYEAQRQRVVKAMLA